MELTEVKKRAEDIKEIGILRFSGHSHCKEQIFWASDQILQLIGEVNKLREDKEFLLHQRDAQALCFKDNVGLSLRVDKLKQINDILREAVKDYIHDRYEDSPDAFGAGGEYDKDPMVIALNKADELESKHV